MQERGGSITEPTEAADSPTGRLWGIGLPLAAALAAFALVVATIGRRDLWLDEAFTVGATNELLTSLWQRSGSMALYYVFIAPWKEISLDPVWLRLPSAVMAAAAVAVTVMLANRWFGRSVATWTAILMVPMWGVTRYGQEARSYALVMLLAAGSWYLFLRVVERESNLGWILWAGCGVAAIYSHPLAGLLLVAQFVALRLPDTTKPSRFQRSKPGWIAVAVLMVPMVASFFQPEGVAPDWVPPLSWWTLTDTLTMVAGPWAIGQLVVMVALVAATVVVVRGNGMSSLNDDWTRYCMVLWLWTPPLTLALVTIAEPMLVGRFVIGSLPAAAIVLALGIDRLRGRAVQIAVGVALLAALIPGHIRVHQYDGPPWSEVVAIIEADLTPGVRHGIIFPSETPRTSFEINGQNSRVLDETMPIYPMEPWRSNLRYWADLDVDDVASRMSQLDVVWLVDQDVSFGLVEYEPISRQAEPFERFGMCRDRSEALPHDIDVVRFVPCATR